MGVGGAWSPGPIALVARGWSSGRDEGGQRSCTVTGKVRFRSLIPSFN